MAAQRHGKRWNASVAAQARQEEALTLAIAGASATQIAERLGYADRSGAWRAVGDALARREPPAEQVDRYRSLHLERTDRLLMSVWPQAISGDTKAVDTGLRILARQSTLLGLDAPTKIAGHDGGALTINVEVTDAREKLSERIDELAQRRLAAG